MHKHILLSLKSEFLTVGNNILLMHCLTHYLLFSLLYVNLSLTRSIGFLTCPDLYLSVSIDFLLFSFLWPFFPCFIDCCFKNKIYSALHCTVNNTTLLNKKFGLSSFHFPLLHFVSLSFSLFPFSSLLLLPVYSPFDYTRIL